MLNLIRQFAQWPLPRPNNKLVATWRQFRFENDSVYDEVTDSEMTLFGAATVSDGMLRVSAASTSNYAEFNHVTFDANEDFYIRATFSSNTPSGSWINQAILGQWSVNAGVSSWLVTHTGPGNSNAARRNKITFIFKDAESVVYIASSAQEVSYGELHTVEVVRKAGTITVYVDGVAGESVYAPLGNPIYNYPKNRVFRFASTNTYEQGGGRRDDIQIIKGAFDFTPGIKPALSKYVRPEYSVDDADAMILQLGFRRGSKLCEINDTPVTLNGTATISKDARLNLTNVSTSYAQIPIPYFGAGDFTIEFMCNISELSANGVRIGHWTSVGGGVDAIYGLVINPARRISFAIQRTDATSDFENMTSGDGVFVLNKDTHIVVERVNGVCTIYVDGQTVASATLAVPIRSQASFRTNGFSGSDACAGRMWNIRIADKALYRLGEAL